MRKNARECGAREEDRVEAPSHGKADPGVGAAAEPCLLCQERCMGFSEHPWRKCCGNCGCSRLEHAVPQDMEDDLRLGRLLANSKHVHLTASVRGGEPAGKTQQRIYKRNRVIVTKMMAARKDPTFSAVTYEWAPPGVGHEMAVQFLNLLPEHWRPIAGTAGEAYRRKQLAHQLPEHDFEPWRCHDLSVDDRWGLEEHAQRCIDALSFANVRLGSSECQGAVVGHDAAKQQQTCRKCGGALPADVPAAFVANFGETAAWHPACFVCACCQELLVDLILFWHEGRPLCGRHYSDCYFARCSGCDELIVGKESIAMEGKMVLVPPLHYDLHSSGYLVLGGES
uniref:LIM and cysteine-rich domains 1 n=1 Tax=Eptatretus burgeri TaxID=7764 RepID=A0A8C4WT36_EPTBU